MTNFLVALQRQIAKGGIGSRKEGAHEVGRTAGGCLPLHKPAWMKPKWQ